MIDEVNCAVAFWSEFLIEGGLHFTQVDSFSHMLQTLLHQKFKDHWYVSQPTSNQLATSHKIHYLFYINIPKSNRGQALRAISVENEIDSLICSAAESSGINLEFLYANSIFPKCTMWIDPYDVSVLYKKSKDIKVLFKTTAKKTNKKSNTQTQIAPSANSYHNYGYNNNYVHNNYAQHQPYYQVHHYQTVY